MGRLLEKLAELEHVQWERWASTLMEQERLSDHTRDIWVQHMIPYEELTESDKENDRDWAKKVIQILLDHGVFIKDRTTDELT